MFALFSQVFAYCFRFLSSRRFQRFDLVTEWDMMSMSWGLLPLSYWVSLFHLWGKCCFLSHRYIALGINLRLNLSLKFAFWRFRRFVIWFILSWKFPRSSWIWFLPKNRGTELFKLWFRGIRSVWVVGPGKIYITSHTLLLNITYLKRHIIWIEMVWGWLVEGMKIRGFWKFICHFQIWTLEE